MGTKVEQSMNLAQTTGTGTSSVTTPSGSKISKFATKSGFLIPKNKLSGSLVPIIRGGKKGGSDASNEENNKLGQRKTKWGPDLTQDTAVRKGRALAYQTRVDQITQQLRLGKLETEDNQDCSSPSQIQDLKSSDHQLKTQELELLELERREAIGEILKLNPSYKAPADYTPLLKEAKVPIPIKEYPAYSVLNLIFGQANDTQKRLEKETGAKVRVYGTKADTGEMVEVTTSDGNKTCGGYDELHVCVLADTYEKIDAAVALIELLVTPVSGNPASVTTTSTAISDDNMNGVALSQGTSSTNLPAVGVSGVAQLIVGSGPAPSLHHFHQHAGPSFPTGATRMPVFPSSGFAEPVNHSGSLISNPSQFNPSTMPSIFGPRPVVTAGFSPVPQNPSLIPSGPQLPQVLQRPYIPHPAPLGHTGAPRNLFLPVSQPTSIQSNVIPPPQLSGNQSTTIGPTQFGRPIMSLPQSSLPAAFSEQPSSSVGWSKVPLNTPTSIGAGNMIPAAPTVTGLQSHPSVTSHPARPNISPVSQQSVLQPAGATVDRPMNVPFFSSSSHSQEQGLSSSLRPSAAGVPGPLQPVVPQVLMSNSSPNVVPGSTPLISPATPLSTLLPPQSGNSASGSAGGASFNAINPPIMAAPRPLRPSSNDFTFQPHRPQNPASEVAYRPNTRPIILHPNQSVHPHQGSQTPSIQPPMHILNPSSTIKGFSGPNVGNQMMQSSTQTAVNFASSPKAHPGPPRHAPFPGVTGVPLMQPRNFNSAPPFVNADGIPRPGGPMQIQQNYPASATRPQSFLAPNQHFNRNISLQPAARPSSSSSGVQQVYDPFSPSVSFNSQLSNNRGNTQKQESDPEYEDLMASVGVK